MNRPTLAQELEPIFHEIQGCLLDRTIAQQPYMHYSDDAFESIIYIFTDVLMSRIWELQEKKNMPMGDRLRDVEFAGYEVRSLIKELTGVVTYELNN